MAGAFFMLAIAEPYGRCSRTKYGSGQALLLANLAPTRNLADERTVACLLAILGKPEVGYALERGNDTASCFALRAVKHILSDTHQPPRAAINRLWHVMDEPKLNPLGKQN